MANVPISKMQVPGSEDVLLLRDSTAANKVQSPTNGNLASLDANGNLTDSGITGDMTTTSATGNPISIANLKSAQIALNPVITFEPIQAGSGTPSPSNVRAISGYDKIEVLSCGKNILKNETQQINNNMVRIGGTTVDNAKYILPPGTYTYNVTTTKEVNFYYSINDTNDTQIPSLPFTFTVSETASYRFWVYGSSVSQSDIVSFQLELGNEATTYEPYHKTTDLSESLGQTVYGMTVYPREGKAIVDKPKKIKVSDLTWTYSSGSGRFWSNVISDASKMGQFTENELVCSKLPTVNVYSTAERGICIYTEGIAYIYAPGISDTTTLNNTYGDAEIVYTVASPTEIQLTPHEIALSEGYAYVSTNGTSIALSYHQGEMASLGDVEKLGQTVENAVDYMKEYIGVNNGGTSVDISGYTSSNPYICPCDGYVVIYSRSSSGYVRLVILGANDTVLAYMYMNVNTAYTSDCTFVKKGMKVYLNGNTTSDSVINFNPIV